MKNHLKRIASPKTWTIDRKANIFVARPNPGAHSFKMGLPLVILIRDVLKFASTSSEVKKMLNNNEILVDGKRRKGHKFIVGLFDNITFPSLKKHYRIELDGKGRIVVKEVPVGESSFKLCKIVGKTTLTKGKVQFNLHDGKNILADNAAKVGDTMVLNLPKLDVKEVLPLSEGASIFLTRGKHAGGVGKLKEIKGSEAIYESGNKKIETTKAYIFVIGKNKPLIEIKNKD
jgi:small subunit ribosomal protein S4e